MGKKLFDYVIGNPPYQSGENESNSRQDPVYPYFYDAAKDLAEKYELISPARFLFNAGLTSKTWNKDMLSDPRIKVESYMQNANDVFPNTDIKGGVAIIYRDSTKEFGAIDEFIPNEQLRKIATKIKRTKPVSIMTIMHGGRSDFLLNDKALKDYPNIPQDRLKAIQKKNPKVKSLGPNEEREIKSSAFDVTPYIYLKGKPKNGENYIRILGLSQSKREWRYINAQYVTPRNKDNNIEYYKVFIPKASGTGKLGETLAEPIIAYPGDTSTPTFISIGKFNSLEEAKNAAIYVHTKFARVLLGILKITQDIVPSKWKYVPLQNFTSDSDIDWSKSVHEIDLQLYRKYGLDENEINFIETHVKEMA